MEDWEVIHEMESPEGVPYKQIEYKYCEGQKGMIGWYWTPENIWFEVWYDGYFIEGGLTLDQAMNYDMEQCLE